MYQYFKIQCKFLKITFKGLFSSKFDHYLGTLSLLLMQLSSVILIVVTFQHKNSLAGYSKAEILFFFSLSFIIQSLIHLFTEGLWLVGPKYIIKGNLDYLLLRPQPVLSQILMAHLHASGIINLVFGIGLMTYSLKQLPFIIETSDLILLTSFITFGFIINFALLLFIASFSFYFQKMSLVLRLYMTIQRLFSYPLDIFPHFVLSFCTFVLPVSFITFFPALQYFAYLKSDLNILTFVLGFVVTAILSLYISHLFWRKGLSNYQGSHG